MGDLLLLGLAITLEPLPLIAFIVVLGTDRGPRNGAAFIAGWVACLVVIVGTVIAVTGGDPPRPNTAPSTGVALANVVLGVLLLAVAAHVRRRSPDHERPPPAWMSRIDRMTPIGAAGLGVLLQPWPLVAAGAAAVAQADLSDTVEVAAVVAFGVAATASLLVMEAYAVFSPEAATEALTRLRSWIERHRDRAIVVIAVVVGLWLIAKGVVALL